MNIPSSIYTNKNVCLKTVIYEFTQNDMIYDRSGNILLHFPYFKGLFWTNFRYLNTNDTIEIGLVVITNDRFEYEILPCQEKEYNIWHSTKWSIPSVNTDKTHSGVYLHVRSRKPLSDLKIEILGFLDIYPDVENYLLSYEPNKYQFVFSNYEGNELINPCGSIFNVENYAYIADILPKAIEIELFR